MSTAQPAVFAPVPPDTSGDDASIAASDWRGLLSKLIAVGAAQAQALLETLVYEHQALVACDPKSLAALLPDKRARIGHLNELDDRIRHALQQTGAPADPIEVARWLAAHEGSGELVRAWRSLVGLLRRCRRQNRLNGTALSLQRLNVERALRVLRGDAAATLYNRRGLEPGFDASRTLGRV